PGVDRRSHNGVRGCKIARVPKCHRPEADPGCFFRIVQKWNVLHHFTPFMPNSRFSPRSRSTCAAHNGGPRLSRGPRMNLTRKSYCRYLSTFAESMTKPSMRSFLTLGCPLICATTLCTMTC